MNKFSIAVPFRTDYYVNYAGILECAGLLKNCLMWTRRPMPGVSPENSKLIPSLGFAAYAAAKTLPPYQAEAARFALYPLYDHWAKRHLQPGDHIISSYAYANECFKWVRKHGGKTFLDGGNSHPDNFWEILSEEHRKWNCPVPPVPRFYYERARRMMEDVDFVLSPSRFVSDSFLARGFRKEQIVPVTYAVNLETFKPAIEARPKHRPLTIINTGSLSLRKGTPYLLEAFRLICKTVPDARLLLTDLVSDSMKPLMAKYADLPIEWAPPLPHDKLAERLREADIFILPSLEDGFARTISEAECAGLPVILTPNTGAEQFVEDGINGSVVPIRDIQAIADEALEWWEKIKAGYTVPESGFRKKVSLEKLESLLLTGITQALGNQNSTLNIF